MVGGASLGCRTCKQRRIKCDERRPTCFNCERSKRLCSGPEDRFKYHYGCKKQHEQLVAALKSSEDPSHVPNIVYSATEDCSGRARSLYRVAKPSSQFLQISPTPTGADRIRANLVHVLEHPNPCFPLQTLGAYLTALPGRVGRNFALDNALNCFLSTYKFFDGYYLPRNPHPKELATYGIALRALRRDIARSEGPPSAELVCAALLMAKYEFYLRKPSYAIVTLAGGATSILKSWGPSGFNDKFELAMFSSHLPTIVIHSIIFGGDRFLDSEEWEELIQKCNGPGTMARKLWTITAKIGGWLHDVRSIHCHSSAHIRVVVETGLDLREQVRELLEDAIAELDFAGIDHLVPQLYTGMTHVPKPSPGDGRDAQRIIEHASYACAALIMVNGALKRLRADDVYDEESQGATSFILAAFPAADIEDHLYFNFVGPAAFGLANENGRRVIVETMHRSLISQLRLSDSADSSELYEVLCGRLDKIYAAMTGGPILLRMHAE